ncbi:DEAD/DEAH box helicase [Anaerocolumna chitinilytica]|uniref:ATP-dependent helicase n=1 Tax=Anaerocolumna chitinilytica TaxID=1727145 RepID=A0A7I8DTR2_9FIRM|nr:DEAD/DEAH box helicase [Anaerocolumna chitinilytica]BCK00705.1 ATP-dependent helicase [Anaerocolumna chitinilytica]
MDVFNRLAPFIQDFIYENKWEELRGNQVAACEVIFDTEDNLLLSSGTASGKTEAAFLPVLTEIYNKPSSSVGILYISPLKALINDQFKRLEQMLLDSNLPVTKWHGDASQTQKNKLIKNPEGLLQITPESLESLITNKRSACLSLFSDLRFVIIDEVHYFMRDVRGLQLLCVLERLKQLTGVNPRRIGLSATLGDISLAVNWLNTGTGRNCTAPIVEEGKKRVRLHIERFVNYAEERDLITRDGSGNVVDVNSGDIGDREHYEYLFRQTLDKKTIIFTNSREETEFIIAHIREIALQNKAPDVYRVHHGNVSALLRENTEDEMKSADEKIVTGATVTLELGIDIGSLDQAVQVGAPLNVSSFAQRLGRCGRRGQVPQLLFTFVESIRINSADILGPINWEFIRTISIIQLYLKDHWIEPIPPQNHAYNLLYHQTMSCLKSNGEMSPAGLAQSILSLGCFKNIPQEDYKWLLSHMINIDQLQRTEHGGLIIGREGEKIVNSHKFLTIFMAPEYLLVKDENRTIGTVDKVYPVGTRFALAGIAWETVDVNEKSKVIFVKKVPGVSVVDWNVDFNAELHTVLVRKVRSVLKENEPYPYLSDRCRDRLAEIQYIARNSGILDNLVTPLSDRKYAIFPWVGTRQLMTLNYALRYRKIKSKLPWITCVYLEVLFEGSKEELESIIYDIVHSDLNLYDLPLPDKVQIDGKYNEFIPLELLRKQFIEDYLDFEGLKDGLS